MSDDLTPDPELNDDIDADEFDESELEDFYEDEFCEEDCEEVVGAVTAGAGQVADEEEYEEISSEEVDRVVAVLEELMESVESENIRTYLEYAADEIFYLVYTDDDLEGSDDTPPEADAA